MFWQLGRAPFDVSTSEFVYRVIADPEFKAFTVAEHMGAPFYPPYSSRQLDGDCPTCSVTADSSRRVDGVTTSELRRRFWSPGDRTPLVSHEALVTRRQLTLATRHERDLPERIWNT